MDEQNQIERIIQDLKEGFVTFQAMPTIDQRSVDSPRSNRIDHLISSDIDESVFFDIDRYLIGSSPIDLRDHSNPTDRFLFSHDVQAVQKRYYSSDEINQHDASRLNGKVPCIQGRKLPSQKRIRVLPKIRIPLAIQYHPKIKLVIFCVREERVEGRRYWYKHIDRSFLPIDFPIQTDPINPLEIDIDSSDLDATGDFELNLRLIARRRKSISIGIRSELVYSMDEEIAARIHPSLGDQISPRLLCTIKLDDIYCWNYLCLSNFIRQSSTKRQTL